MRQVMATTPTDQTRVFTFDLAANKKHEVSIENSTCDIELVNVGKESIEGHDWRFYEFTVSKR